MVRPSRRRPSRVAGRRARSQFQLEPLALCAGDRAQHHCSSRSRSPHYIGRRAPRRSARSHAGQELVDYKFSCSRSISTRKPDPAAHVTDKGRGVAAHWIARPPAASASPEVGAAAFANPTRGSATGGFHPRAFRLAGEDQRLRSRKNGFRLVVAAAWFHWKIGDYGVRVVCVADGSRYRTPAHDTARLRRSPKHGFRCRRPSYRRQAPNPTKLR